MKDGDVIAFQVGNFAFAVGEPLEGASQELLEMLLELQGRRVVGPLREKGDPIGLVFEGPAPNLLKLVGGIRCGYSGQEVEVPEGYFEDDGLMQELGKSGATLLHRLIARKA